MSHTSHRFGSLALCFGCRGLYALLLIAVAGSAAHADITPPQGYIGFQQTFAGEAPVSRNGTQKGLYNIDFEFSLGNTAATLAGTFWSNSLNFINSSSTLPANHVGGDQGGYLGVQVKSATESIAIFSIWWALDARPGAGAHCVDAVEAWYNDDKPWEPRITDINVTDKNRPVAGGPFRSCRLPIKLEAGDTYRLRVYEISDANKPDEPEWWGAWLINTDTEQEQLIGQLQVPGEWAWLSPRTGGFIEHFGPMPDGCTSIPASQSVYYAATADGGTKTASLSANVYGKCKEPLEARTSIDCDSGVCIIVID